MDNIHSANGNVDHADKLLTVAASEGEGQNLNAVSLHLSPPLVVLETSKAATLKAESLNNLLPSVQLSPSPVPERLEDQNNNSQRRSSPSHSSGGHTSPSPSPSTQTPPTKVFITQNRASCLSVHTSLSKHLLFSPCVQQVKRTNLKKPSSERTGHGLRVKFNPLALLLDASLEGEFDLVQRIIYEVTSDYDVVAGSVLENMSVSQMWNAF